ncbi:MAG: thioredoxin domain-containing protein [bacterium]|nr:thioredoxin domain-containing protein [bacterium]
MSKEAKIIIGIVIASVVGLVVAAFTLGSKNPTPTTAALADQALLVRSDSQKIATDSARVTLVEFGDFQCPSCAAAHPIIKQLLNEYPTQVNFVYRNFPLPQHANAQKAAESAEAAGDQGQYWAMFDLLFSHQNDWEASSNAVGIFTGYAEGLKLNMTKFKADLDGNKFFDKVYRDKADGNSLGVNSTPTFYINGRQIIGVLSLDQFKAEVDRELAR